MLRCVLRHGTLAPPEEQKAWTHASPTSPLPHPPPWGAHLHVDLAIRGPNGDQGPGHSEVVACSGGRQQRLDRAPRHLAALRGGGGECGWMCTRAARMCAVQCTE